MENIGPGFTYGAMSSSSLLSWICLATVSAKQAMSSQNFYGVISHAPQGILKFLNEKDIFIFNENFNI